MFSRPLVAFVAICAFSGVLSGEIGGVRYANAADVPISDEARGHFKAGVSYLQDPDGERVEDAYREFKTAYAISSSPKILGNIGFCAMRLERDSEAIDSYSRYLHEVADIDTEERNQIVRDVQTMSVTVARIELVVDEIDARVTDVRVPVKGEKITNSYGPVRGKLEVGMRPGIHVITVRVPGFDDAKWEFEAKPGSRESHSFQMTKTAPPPVAVQTSSAHRPNLAPWIVAGAGAAMVVVGAVTGAVALTKTSSIANKCPSDACPAGYNLDADRSSARTFVRATDVLLIGGGVVLAAGATWLLLSGSNEQPSPTKPAASAMCTGQGCMGTLRVAF